MGDPLFRISAWDIYLVVSGIYLYKLHHVLSGYHVIFLFMVSPYPYPFVVQAYPCSQQKLTLFLPNFTNPCKRRTEKKSIWEPQNAFNVFKHKKKHGNP